MGLNLQRKESAACAKQLIFSKRLQRSTSRADLTVIRWAKLRTERWGLHSVDAARKLYFLFKALVLKISRDR